MRDERDPVGREPEDRLVRELLQVLREDIRAPSSLRAAVMREIASGRPSISSRVREWLFSPRLVPVSPALAGLAAAALAALVLVWPGGAPTEIPTPVEAPHLVVTRFVLVAPGATSVHLTGDFNSWNREGIELDDLRGSGIWTADVSLPPGVHQYTFVVNGTEWVPDPGAALQVADGFGQVNSIVVVPEEGEA